MPFAASSTALRSLSSQDSGPNKTYLKVQASDADGDALHYQWRVTAGTVENRDSPETVWTMPDGPGLHFAYVTVSDAKGGYVEQQYAVSTDALESAVAPRPQISRAAPTITSDTSSAGRLRFKSADTLNFSVAASAAVPRTVYLPDVQVQIEQGGVAVFSGITDLGGELSLPALVAGTYVVKCSTVPGAPLRDCGSLVADAPTAFTFTVAKDDILSVRDVKPPLPSGRNLRVFGHVALSDGAVCGAQSEFFSLLKAATVQLIQPGTMYDERLYQLDLRASKSFRIGRARLQANVDLYNAIVAVQSLSAPPAGHP